MCPVDHRPKHLRRHLGGGAEIVINAYLDEVDVHGGVLVDHGADFVRRVARDDFTGNKESSALEHADVLRVPHADALFTVAAEALDGRDPVACVERELPQHVLFRVVTGLEAARLPNVTVSIDHPRYDGAPGDVHLLGVIRNFDQRCRTDGSDPAVAHDHDGVVNGVGAATVDDFGSHKGDGRRATTATRQKADGKHCKDLMT